MSGNMLKPPNWNWKRDIVNYTYTNRTFSIYFYYEFGFTSDDVTEGK